MKRVVGAMQRFKSVARAMKGVDPFPNECVQTLALALLFFIQVNRVPYLCTVPIFFTK